MIELGIKFRNHLSVEFLKWQGISKIFICLDFSILFLLHLLGVQLSQKRGAFLVATWQLSLAFINIVSYVQWQPVNTGDWNGTCCDLKSISQRVYHNYLDWYFSSQLKNHRPQSQTSSQRSKQLFNSFKMRIVHLCSSNTFGDTTNFMKV